jgi:hypothetical protein
VPVIGWAAGSFVVLALLGLWLGWLATREDDRASGQAEPSARDRDQR